MQLEDVTYMPLEQKQKKAEALYQLVEKELKNHLGEQFKDFVEPGELGKIKGAVPLSSENEDVAIYPRMELELDPDHQVDGGSVFNGKLFNKYYLVIAKPVVGEDNPKTNSLQTVVDYYGEGINLVVECYYPASDGTQTRETLGGKKCLQPQLFQFLTSLRLNLISGEFCGNQFQDYPEVSTQSFDHWMDKALDSYLGTIKLRDVIFLRGDTSLEKTNPHLTNKIDDLDQELALKDLYQMVNQISPRFAAYLLTEDETWLDEKIEGDYGPRKEPLDVVPFQFNGKSYGVSSQTGEVFEQDCVPMGEAVYKDNTGKKLSIYELLFRKYKKPLHVVVNSILSAYGHATATEIDSQIVQLIKKVDKGGNK